MPKTSDGDTVICVGRETIEALGTGEPVKVGDGEYLIGADSYDYPYRRIAELEAALLKIDEALVGSYGEIETMREGDARRILRSIADIVHPSALSV